MLRRWSVRFCLAVDLVWSEHRKLEELRPRIERATRQMDEGYRQVEWARANPDLDDDGIGTAAFWETYFGPDKEQHDLRHLSSEVEARIDAHSFSRSRQAGALLQYTKHGIAVVHRGRGSKAGRGIGSQSLRDVIWEGRNQAMHWDEGRLNANVRSVFAALTAEQGSQFSSFETTSAAFDVVELLSWTSFESVRDDLLSLA